MILLNRVVQFVQSRILAVLEKQNIGINENCLEKEINLNDENYIFSLKFPIDFLHTVNGENISCQY